MMSLLLFVMYSVFCNCYSANQGTSPINRKNLINYPPPRNKYTIHLHLILGYYLHDSD
jgi:hypothetical protein